MVAGATERSGVILTVRKKFDGMMPQRAGEVGGTIALLGRHGLAINNSAQKYTLPSQFSGRHLMSIMFAALQTRPSLEGQLAALALDPHMKRELRAIEAKFAGTEADGLGVS